MPLFFVKLCMHVSVQFVFLLEKGEHMSDSQIHWLLIDVRKYKETSTHMASHKNARIGSTCQQLL